MIEYHFRSTCDNYPIWRIRRGQEARFPSFGLLVMSLFLSVVVVVVMCTKSTSPHTQWGFAHLVEKFLILSKLFTVDRSFLLAFSFHTLPFALGEVLEGASVGLG